MEELLKLIAYSFILVLLSMLGFKLLWLVCALLVRLFVFIVLPVFVVVILFRAKDG